MLKLALFLYF